MKKTFSLLMCASLLMSACGNPSQEQASINIQTPPDPKEGPGEMQMMHNQAGEQPEYLSDLPESDLPEFEMDEGIRIDGASNPAVGISEDGEVYLFHNNTADTNWFDELGSMQPVGYSEDGLEFELIGKSPQTDFYHPSKVQLEDGTWRKYIAKSSTAKDNTGEEGNVTSKTSEDGLTFADDDGLRYEGYESDNGTMGVNDFFLDSKGGVVMLYIGDMGGADNTRRAYSEDTWNFEFEDENVLDDIDAGKHWVHVDPNTTPLSNGNRLLITMVRGENTVPAIGLQRVGLVYGTVLDEDGYPISQPQLLFDYSDYDEFNVWSLNDPVAIQMPDGRIRIYVAALVSEDDVTFDPEKTLEENKQTEHWVILSAVSEEAY